MAYRTERITEQVRIGETSKGDFNIEIYSPSWRDPNATMEEIFIPADAAEDVAKYILKRT